MIVYIAGKMTGLPDKGRAVFAQAERKLIDMGHTVFNPAWLEEGLPKKAYMPICLTMVQQAEAVVLLDGWETSPGALIEKLFAEYQEMPVFGLDEFVQRTTEARQRVWARLAEETDKSVTKLLPGIEEDKHREEMKRQIIGLTSETFFEKLKPLLVEYSQSHYPCLIDAVYKEVIILLQIYSDEKYVFEYFGGKIDE